jgi:hypothetical protein
MSLLVCPVSIPSFVGYLNLVAGTPCCTPRFPAQMFWPGCGHEDRFHKNELVEPNTSLVLPADCEPEILSLPHKP